MSFRRFALIYTAAMMFLAVLIVLTVRSVGAHDHEHPELTPWYKSLKSGNGPCCDGSDAQHLADVDWDTKDGHYRVRLDGQWVDVPPEAVVDGPNRDGRAMVWPYYLNGQQIGVRCFMPGTET